MSDISVRATAGLQAVIQNLPTDQYNAVLLTVRDRTKEFNILIEQNGLKKFVKAFYEMLDEVIAKSLSRTTVSCRKGCCFCCRQNIQLSEIEARLIVNYCRQNKIPIPRAYLEKQLKYDVIEVTRTEVGMCTFLKNGACSIYPVRPVVCRNYHVSSDPQFCDVIRFPSSEGHRVAVAVFGMPTIEVSAFQAAIESKCKSGRLPEMLLPYSK